MVNSLWPSDTIWWQGSRSTLAQVMACCLTAPSHYLSQCWVIITEAISLEISQPSVNKISLKIIFLKIYSNLPGANELKWLVQTITKHNKVWTFCIFLGTHYWVYYLNAKLKSHGNRYIKIRIQTYNSLKYHWKYLDQIQYKDVIISVKTISSRT